MPGMYFEEFEVGQVMRHSPGRTITETDNAMICALTMNPQPLHLDYEFARGTEYGQPLVNSIMTLGLMVGLSVYETTLGTTLGNLGFESMEFPKPVFFGDTLYSETEVLAVRASKSRPMAGIVTFEHRATNQRNEVVARCRRVALMVRRAPAQEA